MNGVDVREQGNALRVATNIPHLVSLGTGRLSTAVTLHPIKQGRVTIGSDPTCDIYVAGTGVCNIHCNVENSHGVVTLYPVNGSTLLDGILLEKPTRLSQGSMLTIGRSNYLRFNHPEEAKLMKSVLPTAHLSMAPIQYQPNEDCAIPVYAKPNELTTKVYQNQSCQHSGGYNNDPLSTLTPLEHELEMSIKELSRKKPPVAPRKPFRDMDLSDSNSNSDQESRPKISSIMAKVSKFEYYAKSTTQKNAPARSKFCAYTHESNDISPKVFSSSSVTCNTPAKDVLGGKDAPTNYVKIDFKRNYLGNNSYVNVDVRKNKVDDIVRNFDDNFHRPPKKVENDRQNNDNIYGKIYSNSKSYGELNYQKENEYYATNESNYAVPNNLHLPSPSFDRNPQYSPVYANSSHFDRSNEAECKRKQAYQDRVKEEAVKEAESARLDEILNMCAEYEKQITSGIPITPTEKKTQNKIITNGSLPRSVVMNNPNFVQTSEGYYKFDTSHNSKLTQRNHSTYENFNMDTSNVISETGRSDEIGIPVKEKETFPINELSSPVMIRKIQNGDPNLPSSPLGSPYENLYANRNLKPRSPNTQSPRSRIKTTFAHKNLPSPQYFVFPTPSPNDKKPEFDFRMPKSDSEIQMSNEQSHTEENPECHTPKSQIQKSNANNSKYIPNSNNFNTSNVEFVTSTPKLTPKVPPKVPEKPEFLKRGKHKTGIEKQLSLEEDLPMIDDTNLTNDIELRITKRENGPIETEHAIVKNKSFDDVKRELMADIPELEEFEKDLQISKSKIDSIEIGKEDATASVDFDGSLDVLKVKYEHLKDEKRKMLSDIHEVKCKMAEIRSQEDDILRELEMEKALIKGEYDSEIAILNIEQKKKQNLLAEYKSVEAEIKQLKCKQESRQNEMRDRVEVATLKVERIEQDIKKETATMEELQNAQDILDNESKIYEDLEFQHLEEESELLSHREDIQNDIALLTKKIDAQKSRILTLKSEASDNLTSALDETKILQAEYVRLLNKVEEMTSQVQEKERELQELVNKINNEKSYDDFNERVSTDSDEPESKDNFEEHRKEVNDTFKKIDQMSQSMIITIEKRDIDDGVYDQIVNGRKSKDKRGFWERNFDSLSRLKKDKKVKPPTDVMSQSLNENFVNNDSIECDTDRFNSLKLNKNKKNQTSKIPTFAALGKIIKKDSFSRKKVDCEDKKSLYVKNTKPISENKYSKSKSLSPDKTMQGNVESDVFSKVLHRKSCGDEPGLGSGEFAKMADSGKVPSQDDIDRISKVTIDAPILSCESDMNSLGRRTLDSLKEIEKKRIEMLEEQGCQVIENEREKILELKRRVQDETKKLWDEKLKNENRSVTPELNDRVNETLSDTSLVSERTNSLYDRVNESIDEYNMTGSAIFEESSGLASSIEELHVRNSRTDSLSSRPIEDDKRSDDSRPLSNASDFSRENILSGGPLLPRRRQIGASLSRPLTRYLPVDRDDFDLRRHIETAGHQVELCPHVLINSTSCRGYLHKLGAKFHTWSKRWFVFDRDAKTFVYYWDKSEKKPRGGAYFQVIEEVYLDHGNRSKSPNPQTTFVVKTRQRRYYLMSPSGEAARIWIDVIFTGAQGYTEYME